MNIHSFWSAAAAKSIAAATRCTRPHASVDQETPASQYRPSERALPRRLAPLEYPGHFKVRLVSRNSGIRWQKHWVCVTHTLAGEYVGLEEVGDGLWDVYFGPLSSGA